MAITMANKCQMKFAISSVKDDVFVYRFLNASLLNQANFDDLKMQISSSGSSRERCTRIEENRTNQLKKWENDQIVY